MQKNQKRSKKKIWIALAIIVGAIVLSGAGLGIATAIKRANCEHVYGAWTVSEEVTCTESGEEERECIECGKTETREIEKYGHEQRMVYAVEATCTQAGRTDGVQCIRCKKILAGCNEVPALGHKEVTVDGYRAECLKDGLTNGVKCGRCDKVIESQKIIPATGHDVVTVEATAPTCTQAGHTSYSYCKGCGEVYGEKEEIAALGHTAVLSVDSDVSCNRCGLNGREAYLEACQWEEAATVTELFTGALISEDDIEGAYRYKHSTDIKEVTVFEIEGFSVAIDGETQTEGTLYVTVNKETGYVRLYFFVPDDFRFEIELDSYSGIDRTDFYLQSEYNCEVIVTDWYQNKTTKNVSVTITGMRPNWVLMRRLELISE